MDHREDVDELLPQPVFEGDPLGIDPPRNQEHLFMFDIDTLDRSESLRGN